jgi:hypothetical protein
LSLSLFTNEFCSSYCLWTDSLVLSICLILPCSLSFSRLFELFSMKSLSLQFSHFSFSDGCRFVLNCVLCIIISSVSLSIILSVNFSVSSDCPIVILSMCLLIGFSVCPSTLSIYLSIYVYIYISLSLSLYLSIYLSSNPFTTIYLSYLSSTFFKWFQTVSVFQFLSVFLSFSLSTLNCIHIIHSPPPMCPLILSISPHFSILYSIYIGTLSFSLYLISQSTITLSHPLSILPPLSLSIYPPLFTISSIIFLLSLHH